MLARIERSLCGRYRPIVLSAGGETVICWREPGYGWCYGWLRDGNLGSGTSICGDDSRECEKRARHHLGSNATRYETCLSADDVDPIVLDTRDRQDIADNCAWQRDYKRAEASGLDDSNIRNLIGGFTQHMTQPIPESLKDWKPESRR